MTPEENLKSFAEVVRKMREFQNAYFSSPKGSERKANCLRLSKHHEGKVDDLIVNILSGQTTIF
jgi:hypothetical protein